MKNINEMTVEELKVRAYDMVVLINQAQFELNQLQQLINNKSNLTQPEPIKIKEKK